jgi:hypothetical protein
MGGTPTTQPRALGDDEGAIARNVESEDKGPELVLLFVRDSVLVLFRRSRLLAQATVTKPPEAPQRGRRSHG